MFHMNSVEITDIVPTNIVTLYKSTNQKTN